MRKGPSIENALSSWGIASSEKKLAKTNNSKSNVSATTKEDDFFKSFATSAPSTNLRPGNTAEEKQVLNQDKQGTLVSKPEHLSKQTDPESADDWPDMNEPDESSDVISSTTTASEPIASAASVSLGSANTSKSSSSIISKKKKSNALV